LRNRAKLFVDNILTYGSVNILARIIPVIMLPIIARLLPNTSDFGVFDLFTVITYFGTALAQMGLLVAIYRFFFETEDMQFRRDVTTTTFHIILVSTLLVDIGLICLYHFFKDIFFTGIGFNVILVSCAGIFVSNISAMFLHPSRMLNERKVYAMINISGAVFQKGLSIVLILLGFVYFGLIYSVIATNIIILCYVGYKNRDYLFKGRFLPATAKALLKFGLPLLPVHLVFWVCNSIDRVMILKYSTLAELGVYAIGAKIGGISNLIMMAFTIGWASFSFTAMKDKDYKELVSTIFSILFAGCTVFYLLLFLCKDAIFNLLFTGDYVRGVEVYPLLLVNPFLLIFIYIMENPLYNIKKTIYFPFIHGVGCLVNIVLNYLLIPRYGIFGAAVATTIGFFAILIVFIVFVVYTKKLLFINIRLLGIMALFVLLFVCINIPGVSIWYTVLPISAYILLVCMMYKELALRYYKRWREGSA